MSISHGNNNQDDTCINCVIVVVNPTTTTTTTTRRRSKLQLKHLQRNHYRTAADNYAQYFEKVCGKEMDVMIYTGTILEVGDEHSEYDV